MHGNVEEWCRDSYRSDVYNEAHSDPWEEPSVEDGSDAKVARGGSFGSSADECRSAARRAIPFSSATSSVGFRPVIQIGD